MSRQSIKFYHNLELSIVQGNFYIQNKRFKRKVCTFAEAGFNSQGELLDKSKTAQKRHLIFLDNKYLEILAELKKTNSPTNPNSLVSATFSDWIQYNIDLKKHYNTIKIHERMIEEYLKVNKDHSLPVDDSHVHQYRVYLINRISAVTINIRLKSLTSFINYLVDKKLQQPVKINKEKTITRKHDYLSDTEVNKLLDRINELIKLSAPNIKGQHKRQTANSYQHNCYLAHRCYLMIALGTGARRSEIFYLTWNDVDLQQGMITVRIKPNFKIKELREKTLILPEFLKNFLMTERTANSDQNRLFDAYSDPHALSTAFRRHFEELGLNENRKIKATHNFRSKLITKIANEVSLDAAQAVAGHQSRSTTEIYFSGAEELKKSAIPRLNFDFLEKTRKPT